MPVLIVGSIALDTVKTPVEEHADLLGGSASYAAVSRELSSPTPNSSASSATDFPAGARRLLPIAPHRPGRVATRRGPELPLVGRVHDRHERARDPERRAQRLRALHAPPARGLPQTPYVLLANIAPSLQSHVLDQMARVRDSWSPTRWTSGSPSPRTRPAGAPRPGGPAHPQRLRGKDAHGRNQPHPGRRDDPRLRP